MDEFDPDSYLLELQDKIREYTSTGAVGSSFEQNGIDLRKRAPNAIIWIAGEKYLNQPTIYEHVRQYQIVRDFFQLLCPICNRGDFDCWGKTPEQLKAEVLLEWDEDAQDDHCPGCDMTRAELVDDGMLEWYETMIGCAGMRSGKSVGAALIGTYMRHVLVTIGIVRQGALHAYFRLMATQYLEIAFVATTATQAKDTIWSNFSKQCKASPWFQAYIAWVKKKEAEQQTQPGVKGWVYKELDDIIEDGWIGLNCVSLNSNSAGMAGRTRPAFFIDELSRFGLGISKLGADEVWAVFDHSLKTVRGAKRMLKLPERWLGAAIAISSPISIDDKTMTLLAAAKEVATYFGWRYATWEFNPFQPRENFDSDYQVDPMMADRDFGANPPNAASPLISDPLRFWTAIDDTAKPSATFELTYPVDPTGRKYVGAKLEGARMDQHSPLYIFGDAGKTFDQFALVACSCVWLPALAQVDRKEIEAHKEARLYGGYHPDSNEHLSGGYYLRPPEQAPEDKDALTLVAYHEWSLRIIPDKDQPVWFESIINILRELKKYRNIAHVAFDAWNSESTLQQISNMGIATSIIQIQPADFVKCVQDASLGRFRLLPPANMPAPSKERELSLDANGSLKLRVKPPELSAPGATLYEILKLERDPDLKKVFNPKKGLVRGYDSDDSARCLVGAHRLIQESTGKTLPNKKLTDGRAKEIGGASQFVGGLARSRRLGLKMTNAAPLVATLFGLRVAVEHGPNWCEHHQVNHHSKTVCPYKGKSAPAHEPKKEPAKKGPAPVNPEPLPNPDAKHKKGKVDLPQLFTLLQDAGYASHMSSVAATIVANHIATSNEGLTTADFTDLIKKYAPGTDALAAIGVLKNLIAKGVLQTLPTGKISTGPKVDFDVLELPSLKPEPAPLPENPLKGKPDAVATSKALQAKGYSPAKAGDLLKALTWLGETMLAADPKIITKTLVNHKAWDQADADEAVGVLVLMGYLQQLKGGKVGIGPNVPGVALAPAAKEPEQSPTKTLAPTDQPEDVTPEEEPTGVCPSGHKTYVSPMPHNCPQCGKVMGQPGAGGTAQKVPADIDKLFDPAYPISAAAKDEWTQVLSEVFSDKSEADPTELVQLLHNKFKTTQKIGPAMVDYQMDILTHAGVLKLLPNGKAVLGDGKAIPKAPAPPPKPAADPQKEKQFKKLLNDNGKVPDVMVSALSKALALTLGKKTTITPAEFATAYEAAKPGTVLKGGDAQKMLMDLELLGILKYHPAGSGNSGYYLGKELPDVGPVTPSYPPVPAGHKPILGVGATSDVFKALKTVAPGAGLKEAKAITDAMAKLLGDGNGLPDKDLVAALSHASGLPTSNITELLDELMLLDNPPLDVKDHAPGGNLVLSHGAGYMTVPDVNAPAPVQNVPTSAEAAATLGWNEGGKGMRLLEALNKNGPAGCSVDDAVQKMTGEKVTSGVAKYLLDKAISAGLVQRVQNSNPPTYIFSKKPGAASAPAQPSKPVKSKKLTMQEVKALGADIVSSLDMLKNGSPADKGIGQDLAFVLSQMGAQPYELNQLVAKVAEALDISTPSTAGYLVSELLKHGLLQTDDEGKLQANTQPTGTCPAGHKTYKSPVPHNCPSCGKVMAPGSAAKAPDELPAQSPLPEALTKPAKPATGQPTGLPAVSSVLGTPTRVPSAEELTFTGKAQLGGAHSDKQFMQDTEGRQYLFKGTDEDSFFRARAGEVYSQMAQALLGVDDSVPVQAMKFPGGQVGSVQPMIPGAAQLDKTGVTVATMNVGQIRDLVRNRVLDWLMSNHDTKPANWVLTPAGKVVGIDREQAFKKIGLDSLDPAYTHAAGASKQIYQSLFEGYASGALTLEPNDALPVIEAAEAISDADYLEKLKPYLDQAAKDQYWSAAEKQAKIKAILERKKNLRADFEQLFTTLNQQRGISEPFKFGQKAPTPAADKVPTVPAAGMPSSGSSGTDALGQAIGTLGLKTPSGQAVSGALGQALAKSITDLFEQNEAPSGANLTLAIKSVLGGSMIDAQAVIAALTKKGIVTKDPGGSGAFSLGAKYLQSGTSAPIEPTAICPAGHKTYLSPVPHNCPSCGKVMQPGIAQDGLSPVVLEEADKVPKTADQFPDALKMIPLGSADGLGGVKDKSFLKDPKTGAEFMFKPDDEDWRAGASATYANIGQKLIGTDRVIPVKQVKAPVKTETGTVKIEAGAMQPMMPGVVSDLQKVNIAGLKPEQLEQLQDERVLDWLMSNHDSKAENFLLMQDGRILGCDKEQAFKFIGQDTLSLDYQPNKSMPIYNQMFRDYAEGKLELDLQKAGALIDKIEAFPDDEYKALVQPYLDSLKGYGYGSSFPQVRAQREAAIMARKKSIRADFEKFFTQLQNQRGVPGPFKFGAGGPPKGPDGGKPAPTTKAPVKAKPVHLPKASTLQDTGETVSGSTAGMKVLADFAGNEYIFKPAQSPYRALAPQAASQLARMVDPAFAVPVTVDASMGQLATLQPKVHSVGTLEQATYKDGKLDTAALTPIAKKDLQRERVIDWVLSNHDTHSRNLLVTDKGRLIGIDKSQSFKHILNDKLSADFHPNGYYGEDEPVYNHLFRDYAAGKVDLDLNESLSAIKAVEATPDAEWMAAVEPYLKAYEEKVGVGTVDEMRTAILERKKSVRSDFEAFYTQLQNARGVPGPFKFSA